MMSNLENKTLLNCELPRSTQSFINMLDAVGQTPDKVTRSRSSRTVSTTFSELSYLTGLDNSGEIESADNQAVNKSSDGSIVSICTTCTQCKLAKRLNGDFDDIGDKVNSVSECDHLSLFVDQINCETETEGRENIPKRYFSDTVIDSPEYSCKRFKSEGFSSASKLQTNSAGGKIELTSAISSEITARYRNGKTLPGDEDPSEPAELHDDNYNNEQHTNVRIESLKDSVEPNEKLTRIENADNAVGQITVSSHTTEVDNSISDLNNIEEIRLADETQDAESILEHESLSPNPSISVYSQSTIEEVYRIEEGNDFNTDDIESQKLSFYDHTLNQSTVAEIHYINATNDVDCSKSIDITERPPPHDSKVKEKPLRDSEEREKKTLQDIEEPRPLTGETAIDLDTALRIDAGLDTVEEQRIGTKPENLGCVNSLETVTVENDEVEVTKKNLNLVDEIRSLGSDIDSLKSEKTSRFLDKSILEVSIDSENMYIQMNSKDNREDRTTRAPVDLTMINKKRVSIENASAGGSKEVNKRDDFGATKQDEKILNPVHMVQDSPANSIPIMNPKKSSEDADDTSLDFLSESELERIEKEAYTQSKETHITTNSKNVNLDQDDKFYRPQRLITGSKNEDNLVLPSRVTNPLRIEKEVYIQSKETHITPNLRNVNLDQDDKFYRPQRLVTESKDCNNLVLPSWVTNPAPEPNYDMIRCRNQSQKEYINKILQEVLRLSKIISKVGKAVRGEQQVKDSDTVPQIQDPRPDRSAEDYLNSNSRASTSTENRGEDSDIFYVPQSSSRPKHNASNISHSIEPVVGNCSDIFYMPQFFGRPKSNEVTIRRPVQLKAPVNTVDVIKANYSVEIREPDKLYVPKSGQSKYDASFMFSRENKLNLDKASCSYINTEATSFYDPLINSGASKRDWSGNKTGGYSSNNVAMNDRRSELPKNRLQAPFESDNRYKTENGNIDRINNCKTVTKDAVFYTPDNLSSASSKYTKLPSVQNSQIFFSKNLVSERFGSDPIPVEPTSLNFENNLIARTNRNDNDSVFYSGNK